MAGAGHFFGPAMETKGRGHALYIRNRGRKICPLLGALAAAPVLGEVHVAQRELPQALGFGGRGRHRYDFPSSDGLFFRIGGLADLLASKSSGWAVRNF